MFGQRRDERVEAAAPARPAPAGPIAGRDPVPVARSGPEALAGPVARSGPAALLRPDRRVVEFTGRTGELAGLRAWYASDPARSVRVLQGAGGVGKTRLAQQIAAQARVGDGQLLTAAAGSEAHAVQRARAAHPGRLLLVVDHAESRPGLDQLLTAAAEDPGPLRVLLITRSLGEWWDRLVEGAGPEVVRLLTETEPVRLQVPVRTDMSDAELAQAAVPHFARALQGELRAPVEVERAARRVPTLMLHAAALVAVLRFAEEPGPVLRVVVGDGVLDELLEHEARYWRGAALASGLPGDATLVDQVVAAAALLGAGSVAEAAAVVGRVPDLAGSPDERRREWARWLYALYPDGPGGRLGSPQPELVAEAHVAAQLVADHDLARSCLLDLGPEQAERAMTMLARASAHQERVRHVIARALRSDLGHLGLAAARAAVQTANDLGDLLTRAISEAAVPPETLAEVALALPYPSAVLAPAHLAATLRALESPPHRTDRETRARWDDRAGLLLSQLDRHADAMRPAQEAVTIRRELAAGNPSRYRAGLAVSLTRLGARFGEAERPAEAVRAEQEAVSIFRDLASADPGRYRADLAASLTNLGAWCSESGHPADAVPPTQEAVTIYRELAAATPGRYRPDLAAVLTNLGIWFSELGRPADGVGAGEEAAAIRRELANDDPEAYRPDLARSLSNLGIWFCELGRPADALRAEQEAVAIRRELAAAGPERYAADLATSLANLGITYSQLAHPADALPAIKEAITTYRELAHSDPDQYRPGLARSLTSLGSRYSELGRPAAAVPPIREAVAIRRSLAAVRPDLYRPDLARSLTNLGTRLAGLGRPAAAVPPIQEAVSTYRELAAANPDLYRPDLARALSVLAAGLSALDRKAEAARAAADATAIRQELEMPPAADPA